LKNFIILFLFISIGLADISDELFSQGNNAMINENYEDAVQIYESILELGFENPNLYYNLGNAYYRLHYIGQSIWAYSNAIKMSPRESDFHHNLSVAKARKIDRIDMPDAFILLKKYRELKNRFILEEWVILGSLVLLLQAFWFFGLQFGWIRGNMSQTVLSGLIVLTIGIHVVATDKYFQEKRTHSGVVIANGVDAYSGPFYGENTVLFRINEGSNADINQSQKNWVEIILIDGKRGWIPSESIRTLK